MNTYDSMDLLENKTDPKHVESNMIGRYMNANDIYKEQENEVCKKNETTDIHKTAGSGRWRSEHLKAWLQKDIWSDFVQESKNIMRLASGLVMIEMCQMIMQPMAIMFAGRLGKIEMDAVALANSVFNVFGNAVCMSLSLACDTVFTQTYGSSNRAFLGVQLQKSMIIFAMVYMICLSIQLNFEHVLFWINIDEEVARLTGTYLELMAPGLLNAIAVHIVVSVFGILCHGVAQYLLVYYFQLGVIGSAIAQDLGILVMVVVYVVYVLVTGFHKETWEGLDRRCLLAWGPFFHLAVYSMLMICMEWWALETTVILAGTKGITDLSVQTVFFNLYMLGFGMSNGVSVATQIRLGQSLGAGNVLGARKAITVGTILIGTVAILLSVLLLALRNEIPKLFTSIEDVVQAVAMGMGTFATFVLFDVLCASLRRLLASTGKQKVGFISISISHYLLGLPIGLYLWWKTPLGLTGIWFGLAIGVVTNDIMVYSYLLCWVHWETLAQEAVTRAMEGTSAAYTTVPDRTVQHSERSRDKMSLGSYENLLDERSPLTNSIVESSPASPFTSSLLFRRAAGISACTALCITAVCTNILLPVKYSAMTLCDNGTLCNITLTDVTEHL